ncbi:MAG: TatD DNase family protein [Parcubacteria group bacterium Licking1014_17]|nr:MAG: TatD DNase family protein [Parcubacteria group bacterium Licking1014_17]
MKLIDTHCHLAMKQYDADCESVIKRAQEEGVGMVSVGLGLESSKKTIELAEKYENIWVAIGLHPNDREKFEPEKYKELAKNKKVVAIGEAGLDYYRMPPEDKERQKALFIRQIDLAKELNLPLIIHCRDSHDDTKKILKEKNVSRAVVHSFTGNQKDAEEYLSLGYYLGFNGIITFSNQYDEIIKNTPIEKILIETDAPFLAPPPFRGKRNEPAYAKYVAEKIAKIKNMPLEEISGKTTENAVELLSLSSCN